VDLNIRSIIGAKIRRKGPGWVGIVADFAEISDDVSVRQAISVLCKKWRLRRIVPGVFHYPRKIGALGIDAPPDPEAVARAVARRKGYVIAPSGPMAVNRLGLSAQVAGKLVFLTDGPDETFQLGKLTVSLCHRPANQIRVGGTFEKAVVQAILHIGPQGIIEEVRSRIGKLTSPARRIKLLRAADRVGDWAGEVIRSIAATATGA